MQRVSTRQAEIAVAGILALLAIYFMAKASELPIGWVPQQGPGGGAFPFWLSAIMLVGSTVILVRAWFGRTEPSRSTRPFVDPDTASYLGAIVASLVLLLLAIHVVGVYVALPLFMLFHLRFLGQHSWKITGSLVVGAPLVLFFLFEVTLKTMLPKGYTEPLFYPLYAIFL